jgi:hypothetical protein
MINRENWKAVNAYLQYRLDVDQISSESQRLEKSRLRYLLEWADDRSFQNVPSIRPVYPEYVFSFPEKPFSAIYIQHVIGTASRFFFWFSKHYPGTEKLTQAWIDTLKRPRMAEDKQDHEFVTLSEIRQIANAPVETLRERRIRAAAVFWWLSGVRIGAFVTLPILAIDLERLHSASALFIIWMNSFLLVIIIILC